MREVAVGIYAIDGLKSGRSYLIDDRGAITLVDTSTATAAARIIDAIVSLGRKPEDLRTIVATHYHYDHTGNVAALVERTGAELFAHADDAPYIDGRKPWRHLSVGPFDMTVPESRYYRLKVDRELRTGDVLPIAGGFEVLHTPGHTPGSISLYSRERGVLFTGDALGNWFGLQLPLPMPSHDMQQAKRSVHQLAALEYEIALLGHGNPILGRASEKIANWSKRWLRDV
jgi:glyoxylase-like metal-dependent hydrolase (beta-lactamase superfamily II)